MRSRTGSLFTRAAGVLGVAFLLASISVSVPGCSTEGGMGGCSNTARDRQADEASQKWAADDAAAAKAAAVAPKKDAPGTVPEGTVMQSVDRPEGEPVLMWKAGNDGGIDGGGGKPPTVTQDKAYFVTEVCAYHWNNGTGAPAGEISLKATDGKVYGPWKTTLRNSVYWIAQPNQDIPAGTYTLIDSDPSTWAQNSGSGGTGMGWAYGIPVK